MATTITKRVTAVAAGGATSRVSGAITADTTKRVTAAVSTNFTRRVAIGGHSSAYDAWADSWGDTWGETWKVSLSAAVIGQTPRISGAITADITKRVTL